MTGPSSNPALSAEAAFDRSHPSLRIGETAFAHIHRDKTSAKPQRFETWYAYVSGHHPKIRQAIDDVRARTGLVNDSDLETIFDQFLSPMRFTDHTCSLSSDLAVQLESLVRAIEQNHERLGDYRTSVQGTADELESATISAQKARSLIDALLTKTRDIAQANDALQAQLETSREEISDLHQALEAVRLDSLQDGLTGLSNRNAFDTELSRAVARSEGGGPPFSLLMIDVDRFKLFNDKYGHITGDQVLRLVATTIRQLVRSNDVVARYGGEEFAIVLQGADSDPAFQVAEKIRIAIMTKDLVKRSTGEVVGKVTVSIGTSTFQRGDTPAMMVEKADACLYAAKRSGRNRTVADDGLQAALAAAQGD